jgi:hypothetical protein
MIFQRVLVIVVLWKILPGADEAMMFNLVTSLRITCWIHETSSVVGSILQPSSEVFQLFDGIIVLDKGQIMFQGPCQDAVPYFESSVHWKKKTRRKRKKKMARVHTYIHTYIEKIFMYYSLVV